LRSPSFAESLVCGVPRLRSTTDVIQVAPPAVVVRAVVGALQVHTREGVPRLELVVTRGRPLLRPGWGRVRLALFSEHVPLFRFHRSEVWFESPKATTIPVISVRQPQLLATCRHPRRSLHSSTNLHPIDMKNGTLVAVVPPTP